MWATTDRFKASLPEPHDVLAYCDLLADGLVALTVDGSPRVPLLTGGRVTVGPGAVQRTAALNLADPYGSLVPVVDAGLLIPRTSEVRVWAGLRYFDATRWERAQGDEARRAGVPQDAPDVEFVPVFTGPITGVDLANYPQIGLSASDRMWYAQSPFSVPFTVPAGLTLDDAIGLVLAGKVRPTKLVTNLPKTSLTSALLVYDPQADPSSKIAELGTAAGWTVYADQMGTFTADDEPTLDPAAVVASYVAGPGGMLIRPQLSYNVQNMVNTWVVTGDSTVTGVAPAWAKVTDDDPTSPTYVRGSYDEQTDFFSSPLLRTDAQALLAAKTRRARRRGLAGAVVATVFPDPSREKGDVYEVTGGLVDQLLLNDGFDYELVGAAQDITARAATADVLS